MGPDSVNLSKRQRRILAFIKKNGPVLTSEVTKAAYPKQRLLLQRQVQYVVRTLNTLRDLGLIINVEGLWTALH